MSNKVSLFVMLTPEIKEKVDKLAHYYGFRSYSTVVETAVEELFSKVTEADNTPPNEERHAKETATHTKAH